MLAPEALLSLGLSAGAKVLDLRLRFRCRGWGARGARSGLDKVAAAGGVSGCGAWST